MADVMVSELVQALEALLPVPALGMQRNLAMVAIGDEKTGPEGKPSHVVLPHCPTAITAISTATGETVGIYTANHITGRLELPTVAVGEWVRISYQFSIADDLIRQAVNDLGRKLPRRNVAKIYMHRNEGALPEDLITLISVGDQPCCGAAVQVGGCELFVSGGKLVAGCGACPGHYYICYMGGYPCRGGRFEGLTPPLADLVLLKAQALAYRSPRILMALAGAPMATGEAVANDENTETTVTTEEKDRCDRSTTTTTVKTASGSYASVDSFLSSTDANAFADSYERQYVAALGALGLVAIIPGRRIYRRRLGY